MEKTLAQTQNQNPVVNLNAGDDAQREKRARTMAALGLVTNRGSHYQVMGPRQGRTRVTYTVWRARDGKPHCTCPEYRDQAANGATFYCEHILAVKYAVLAQQQDAGASSANRPAEQPKLEAVAAESVPFESLEDAETEMTDEEPREVEAPRAEVRMPEVKMNDAKPNLAKTNLKEAAMKRTKPEAVEPKAEPKSETPVAATETAAQPNVATLNVSQSGANVVPFAFAGLLKQLKHPVDPRLIKSREGWTDRDGQKHMVDYVEWHTVADILDRVAPDWSHAVRNITQIGEVVAVTAAITINGVTREGIGTGSAENETGIKKAEHDALKRAAVKFGIARDLYQRESEVIEREGAPQSGGFPRNPLAKSVAELATPKQLGMIRALSRDLQLDADEECRRVLNLDCRIEELSRRAASSFIDHLKRQQEESGEPNTNMRRAS